MRLSYFKLGMAMKTKIKLLHLVTHSHKFNIKKRRRLFYLVFKNPTVNTSFSKQRFLGSNNFSKIDNRFFILSSVIYVGIIQIGVIIVAQDRYSLSVNVWQDLRENNLINIELEPSAMLHAIRTCLRPTFTNEDKAIWSLEPSDITLDTNSISCFIL